MESDKKNKNNRYDHIINLKYPNPDIEADFPVKPRYAAQFMPFMAVKGYKEALDEVKRMTTPKIELGEDAATELDVKLSEISNGYLKDVNITYFVADKSKSGGEYVTVCGRIKKVKEYEKVIVLEDKTEINIKDIRNIEELSKTQESNIPQKDIKKD